MEFTQQVHAGLVGNRLPVWPSAHVARGDATFADEDWFAEAEGLAGEVGDFNGVEVALEMLRNRLGFRLARVDVDIHKIESTLQQCEGSRGDARVICLILGPGAGPLPADGVEVKTLALTKASGSTAWMALAPAFAQEMLAASMSA